MSRYWSIPSVLYCHEWYIFNVNTGSELVKGYFYDFIISPFISRSTCMCRICFMLFYTEISKYVYTDCNAFPCRMPFYPQCLKMMPMMSIKQSERESGQQGYTVCFPFTHLWILCNGIYSSTKVTQLQLSKLMTTNRILLMIIDGSLSHSSWFVMNFHDPWWYFMILASYSFAYVNRHG